MEQIINFMDNAVVLAVIMALLISHVVISYATDPNKDKVSLWVGIFSCAILTFVPFLNLVCAAYSVRTIVVWAFGSKK